MPGYGSSVSFADNTTVRSLSDREIEKLRRDYQNVALPKLRIEKDNVAGVEVKHLVHVGRMFLERLSHRAGDAESKKIGDELKEALQEGQRYLQIQQGGGVWLDVTCGTAKAMFGAKIGERLDKVDVAIVIAEKAADGARDTDMVTWRMLSELPPNVQCVRA